MRVAIVGAGALGCVYGARLERFADCHVIVVGREPAPPTVVRLERVSDGDVLEWNVPARVASVPPEADVVLGFVRYEQLLSLPARIPRGTSPVVVMTPMMPQDHALLANALPGRVVAAMPSVVSYEKSPGVIRHWLPRSATTYIDQRPSVDTGPEAELVERLGRAGFRAKLEPGILTRNVATTVSFIPLAMALDVAGSVAKLTSDRALLSLAFSATSEGRKLGAAIGEPEAWAANLLRFAGPLTLKIGIRLARSRSAEALEYAEQHFGRKLHAQNVAMAARIVELATARAAPHESLRKLQDLLQSVG